MLPILYGDTLVARLDPKLDRKTMTLQINGFWLEEEAPLNDPAFADALGKELARLRPIQVPFAGDQTAPRCVIAE